jgi:signal transduction histidine kinase
MHRFKAENNQLSLQLNATSNVPDLVNLDGSRFTQILVNLISNALKFTKHGGVTVNLFFSKTDLTQQQGGGTA